MRKFISFSLLICGMQFNMLRAQGGYAMKFVPGDGGHVWSIDNESMSDVTNNFTMEFWIKPYKIIKPGMAESNTGWEGLSDQNYAVFPGYQPDANASALAVSVGMNGVAVLDCVDAGVGGPDGRMATILVHYTSISSTEWTHIAIVCNNRTPILYINGVFAKTGLTSTATYVHPSAILGDVSSYGGYGYGPFNWGPTYAVMDEFRIWSLAADPDILDTWYDKHITSGHPYYSNLHTYWKFDEGSGDQTADITGHGHTGVITYTNPPAWVAGWSPLNYQNTVGLNHKWSSSFSVSNGDYPIYSISGSLKSANTVAFKLQTASNEFTEATLSIVRGVVRRVDANGAQVSATVVTPDIPLAGFPIPDRQLAGIARFDPSDEETDDIVVAFNLSPSVSRLVKLDASGNTSWDIPLPGINNIVKSKKDLAGNTYIIGRTPVTNCGAQLCNGIAVAKYDANGVLLWQEILFAAGGYTTIPADLKVDETGNVYVCGKRATAAGFNGSYPTAFIAKFSSNGTQLFQQLISETSKRNSKMLLVVSDPAEGFFFGNDIVGANNSTKYKLRRYDANGTILWTKMANNTELYSGFADSSGDLSIVFTSTGMRAYDNFGTALWSNSFKARVGSSSGSSDLMVIANNVDPAAPQSYFLLKLNATTGEILLNKNLSFGGHDVYFGNYEGIDGDGDTESYLYNGIDGDGDTESYIIFNDNKPQHGVRITKLLPCSSFIFGYNASVSSSDLSNISCNNGSLNIPFGNFNSWAHIETWKGSVKVAEADPPVSPYSLQNLGAGAYTVKIFDENCAEWNTTVTITCPFPTGLNTSNITRNRARLNWTLPFCTNGTQLQYRLQGAANWTTENTANNYRQLNGLAPNSTYEWRLATRCNTTSPEVYSGFTDVQVFSTSDQLIVSGREENTETEILTNSGFSIFPNPSKGQVTITLNPSATSDANNQVQIYNQSGQLVKQINTAGQSRITVQMDKSGVYIARMINGKETMQRRFVVIK